MTGLTPRGSIRCVWPIKRVCMLGCMFFLGRYRQGSECIERVLAPRPFAEPSCCELGRAPSCSLAKASGHLRPRFA